MSFQRVHQFTTQNPQTSWSSSQFAPRPFPAQEPHRPPTQEEIENQAFEQDKFEATGLQLKEKYDTLTPIEQEKLGMLQAKMDSFWAQRMERAKAQPNLLEILIRNAQATPTMESAASVQPKLTIGQPSRATSTTAPALPVQPKLTIGKPNDQYEEEANRVAEQVMSMTPPATPNVQRQTEEEEQAELQKKPLAETMMPLVQRQESSEAEDSVQMKCEACEQEQPVQRAADEVSQVQPDLESRLNATQAGGAPLPDDVRGFMEPRFGNDFSQVRVHTGSDAVQMNQELGAQAFTHGSHIYYGAGKAPAKDELTGHELTHVVQQTDRAKVGRINRASAKNIIQRDEVSAESIADQLSQDLIYERLSQIVYQDELPDWARRQLRDMRLRPRTLREGDYDFQMRGFENDDEACSDERLPVLAFRGSQEFLDWVDDVGPQGVGNTQFRRNLSLVEQEIDDMGGRVDVTGHSLGGTLAQLVAVLYRTKIRRVITFQSPGLPPGIIDSLVDYNNRVPEEQRVASTHYRAEGDAIDDAGYGFTPGTVYELPTDALVGAIVGGITGGAGGAVLGSTAVAHTTRILAEINRLRREDTERFRELTIEVHRTATESDARGFRPGEITREIISSVSHDLLEWFGEDNRVARRVLHDPGYLRSLSFEQKVELCRILNSSDLRDDNLDALILIIRSMTSAQRAQIRDEIFSRLPGSHTLPLINAFDSPEPANRTLLEGTEDREESSDRADAEGNSLDVRRVPITIDDVWSSEPRDVTEEGRRLIVVEFYARVEDEQIDWGRATVRSAWDREAGRYVPVDPRGPSMSLNTHGLIANGEFIDLQPVGFSFTRFALEAMNRAYAERDRHGREPDTLRGDLDALNLLRFQQHFFLIKRANTRRRSDGREEIILNREEIAQQAIRLTSFGRHRVDMRYNHFELSLGSDQIVDLGELHSEELGSQVVPSSVSAIARR